MTLGELSAALRAARKGREEAFRLVYRHVQPKLLRYLTVLVAGDADGIAMLTWQQIAADLAALPSDGEAFMQRTLAAGRAHALRHLRTRGEPFRQRPAADLDWRLSTDAALAAIAALPRDEAEAVVLRAVVGLSTAAAATVMEQSPASVAGAAHRGLRRLEAALAQEPMLKRPEGP